MSRLLAIPITGASMFFGGMSYFIIKMLWDGTNNIPIAMKVGFTGFGVIMVSLSCATLFFAIQVLFGKLED